MSCKEKNCSFVSNVPQMMKYHKKSVHGEGLLARGRTVLKAGPSMTEEEGEEEKQKPVIKLSTVTSASKKKRRLELTKSVEDDHNYEGNNSKVKLKVFHIFFIIFKFYYFRC